MGILIFLAYSALAIYSGYKMVNGRYAWLERDGIGTKICKCLVVLGAGYVIGVFYLIWLIIRIALKITD